MDKLSLDKLHKVAFFIRNNKECPYGKYFSRIIMLYIKHRDKVYYKKILPQFVQLGYWKDILIISELELTICGVGGGVDLTIELDLFATGLCNGDHLCAKWAPSEKCHFNKSPLKFANKLMKHMGLTPKKYRNMVVSLRNTTIENLMSSSNFEDIYFDDIPSKAYKIYKYTFLKNTNRIGEINPRREELREIFLEYLEKYVHSQTFRQKVN